MEIFNKNAKNARTKNRGATTIAFGTTLNGDIVTECPIHVDGKIIGIIKSNNTITIGKSGNIEGSIIANKIMVSGSLSGEVEANEVEILKGGNILGKVITTSSFVILEGGYFEGESKKNKEVTPSIEVIPSLMEE